MIIDRPLVVWLAMAFSLSVHADYELGVLYYEQGRLDKAYEEFVQAAEYGNKQAQFNLGAMYIRGEHVSKDLATGYAWLALSSEKNDGDDSAVHKRLYESFNSDQKIKADENFLSLSKDYNEKALLDKIRPKNIETISPNSLLNAIRRVPPQYPPKMLSSMTTGIADIIFTVDKDGITRDHLVLFSTNIYFGEAALQASRHFVFYPEKVNGEPVASYGIMHRVTFDLSTTEYAAEDIQRSIDTLKENSASGNPEEIFKYAFYLNTLSSVLRRHNIQGFDDIDDFEELYWQAASKNHPMAAYLLGTFLFRKDQSSMEAGITWLKRAGDLRIADARYILGMELMSGARIPKNEEKALFWLNQAAEGTTAARVRLAWVLSTHPNENIRNQRMAKEYLDSIDKDYIDKQGYYQAIAAQAAESGDFRKAVKWQQLAIRDAKRLKLPETLLQARLAAYEKKHPWRELP